MTSATFLRRLGAGFFSSLVAAALPACGPDLGKCDMAALGGSLDPAMPRPHTGQVLIDQKCASGRCHSESAVGAARVGAPAGLDFDVVPADGSPTELAQIRRGATNVDENAEEMWAWIDDGTMPPPGQRTPPTGAEKEAIRNWLACGAEVIAAPIAVDPNADAWSRFYGEVSGECLGCHAGGSTMGPWMGTDACSSYLAVTTSVASTAECAGRPLVAPGNPDGSALLAKLEGSAALCGALMPLGATTAYAAQDATRTARVQALRAWIAAGAPKPASCP